MGHRRADRGGQGPRRPGPARRRDAAGRALSQLLSPNPVLTARTGFELELLAPRGSSRASLATELAARTGGAVRPVFHTDSEPSRVPGMGHFLHLTQGFEVLGADGGLLCTLVDDITLATDLDHRAPPRPGWYRLLSDDARLLRLVAARADPAAPLATVLGPVAEVFGVAVQAVGPAVRVSDPAGATIALGAPLPGERERPCEVVTPPLSSDHDAALELLLAPARDLGFTVPLEAAVHVHLDAAPFRTVAAFSNVVRLFARWRGALWHALGTNPACRRLGAVPAELVELVERHEPAGTGPAGWRALRAAARGTGVSKFCDVNLTRVLQDAPTLDTLEVRVLPGSIDTADVLARAALVEALLLRCQDERPLPRPRSTDPERAAGELLALAAGEG